MEEAFQVVYCTVLCYTHVTHSAKYIYLIKLSIPWPLFLFLWKLSFGTTLCGNNWVPVIALSAAIMCQEFFLSHRLLLGTAMITCQGSPLHITKVNICFRCQHAYCEPMSCCCSLSVCVLLAVFIALLHVCILIKFKQQIKLVNI